MKILEKLLQVKEMTIQLAAANVTANLDRAGNATIFFIIEEAK